MLRPAHIATVFVLWTRCVGGGRSHTHSSFRSFPSHTFTRQQFRARAAIYPVTLLACMLAISLAQAQPRPHKPIDAAQAAPFAPVTLANTYRPELDVSAYWVSEKYDGIRAYWDGSQLISRQHMSIQAPAWFTQHWPSTPMDGELWAGRGQFHVVQSAIGALQPADAVWRKLQFMVFDLPAAPGTFSERQALLQRTVGKLRQPWVKAAPQWRVSDHTQLMQQLESITQAGAEGLMLRREDAPYRRGRSDDLIKLKRWDDAEAVVIQHLPGQGKYAGMTGALLVQMPNGQQFKLGSGLSDAQRRHPPAIGSTITYRHHGHYPSGLPRSAVFWRERTETKAAP